ncbi:hypothetical protein J6590_068162 [Homalodisca vitripennis]|nr:hypothetical protein J6590_068162 [Homalodisca vitripennis]
MEIGKKTNAVIKTDIFKQFCTKRDTTFNHFNPIPRFLVTLTETKLYNPSGLPAGPARLAAIVALIECAQSFNHFNHRSLVCGDTDNKILKRLTKAYPVRFSAVVVLIEGTHSLNHFNHRSLVCGDTDRYIYSKAVNQGRSNSTCCGCGADRMGSLHSITGIMSYL